MKEKLERPEIEVISFENNDIITNSNEHNGPTATVPDPFVVEEGEW